MSIMELPTGSVKFCNPSFRELQELEPFFEGKSALKDYETFKFSVLDTLSSMILSNLVKNEKEDIFCYSAKDEEAALQDFDFKDYLESCSFIRHDSSVDQVLRDDRLDRNRFLALSEKDIRCLIERHISDLMKVNYYRQRFAFRSGLARCENMNWNDGFEKIQDNLKRSYNLRELYRGVFEHGVRENISLFDRLKKDADTISADANAKSEWIRSKALKEMEKDHNAELRYVFGLRNMIRAREYNGSRNLKILMRKRAWEAQASSGLRFLPKEFSANKVSPKRCQLSMQLLSDYLSTDKPYDMKIRSLTALISRFASLLPPKVKAKFL